MQFTIPTRLHGFFCFSGRKNIIRSNGEAPCTPRTRHFHQLKAGRCCKRRVSAASSHQQATINSHKHGSTASFEHVVDGIMQRRAQARRVITYTSHNHHRFHVYKPQLLPFPQNHAAPRASAARYHVYKPQSSPFSHVQASIASFSSWLP